MLWTDFLSPLEFNIIGIWEPTTAPLSKNTDSTRRWEGAAEGMADSGGVDIKEALPPGSEPDVSLSESEIEYVSYDGEHHLPLIMSLVDEELSEPYSIFTYRYFVYIWPNLSLLVIHKPHLFPFRSCYCCVFFLWSRLPVGFRRSTRGDAWEQWFARWVNIERRLGVTSLCSLSSSHTEGKELVCSHY